MHLVYLGHLLIQTTTKMSDDNSRSGDFNEDFSKLPYHHDHFISKVKKKPSKTITKPQPDKRDNVENIKAKILKYIDDNEGKLDELFIGKEEYTPMQFAAKYGVEGLAESLLKENADPNYVLLSRCFKCDAKKEEEKDSKNKISMRPKSYHISKPEHDDRCMSPLLLAAKYGQHEIIKLFKYCQAESVCESIFEHSSKEKMSFMKSPVDFKQTSLCKKETVLQVVLRQPMLQCGKQNTQYSDIKKLGKNMNEEKRSELRNFSKRYQKCINVLLDMDKFKNKELQQESFLGQVREIVNYQDSEGNTALHYAVSNWSGEVVEKLLGLGANACIKNKRGEVPLNQITKRTFEEFLDERAIIVEDFDPSDNEMEEEDEDPEGEILDDEFQSYNQNFMMKINHYGKDPKDPITFDYAFLAPPKARNKEDQNDLEKNNKSNTESTGSKIVPEMDFLIEMCKCNELRSLITHPVIGSFLWLKWKMISTFHNRILRLRFLFLYIVLWNTFTQFGGLNWMTLAVTGEKTYSEPEKTFCEDQKNEFKLYKFHFDNIRGEDIWYIIFLTIFIIQVFMIKKDWDRDLTCYKRTLADDKSCLACHYPKPWLDFFSVLLSAILLLCGQPILWFVISILLVFFTLMEVTEMLSVGRKYFGNSSNYIDLAMILLTFIIMYVPTEMIWNPQRLGRHTQDKQSKFDRGCEVKRAISAVIIVLVFCRYLGSMAQLPGFKKYNIYLIMFNKVMISYFKVMVWFACYILAFGLGFYIMLHDDTKSDDKQTNSNTARINGTKFNCYYCEPQNGTASQDALSNSLSCYCDEKDEKTKFDHPFLALTKTWTMFVGEIDFEGLRIKGGDISTTMGYIYLLSFVFMIVIVVMNLLNGLAVSDIQKIVSESKIETETSLIETIKYLEAVCINSRKLFIFSGGETFVPSQILVFESSRLTAKKDQPLPLRLVMSIKEPTSDTLCNCCKCVQSWFCSVFWFLNYDFDENRGSDAFIGRARKILAHLWKAKIQKRKQNELAKEIRKIEGKKGATNGEKPTESETHVFYKKKFEQLKDETLKDQIRNLEDILKQMSSDSTDD